MSDIDRRPPDIDYLAKDYASFRRLMLDHLSRLVPDWQEQNPADLGIALVEVLAYAADYLSYYQDAVATEAYLGTARLRRSVRRHARLLDYHLHEGCNARAWVQVQVQVQVNEEVFLPIHTQFLTRLAGRDTRVIGPGDAAHLQTLQADVTVFETMYDVHLLPRHNEIQFYHREGNVDYLPRGATSACLQYQWNRERISENLNAGDVLVFEELRDPHTGLAAQANPSHRHVVRLTKVTPRARVLEIEWAAADALPFALYIAPYFDGRQEVPISVARGNLVLADHGRTIKDEELPVVQPLQRYRPRLRMRGLTHAVPFYYHVAEAQPAREAVQYDPQEAISCVQLCQHGKEVLLGENGQDRLLPLADEKGAAIRAQILLGENGQDRLLPLADEKGAAIRALYNWTLRRDLLDSGPLDRDFLVESEDDGAAYLRFGFAGMGKLPLPGDRYVATYRIGNGTRGNVGADTIAHVVVDDVKVETAITGVRNPLPARGGRNPEDIESARLNAPHAFRTQQTCVTEADCAEIATRHPAVARAVAQMRWIGSGHTVFVYAQRAHGQPEDEDFRRELRAFMEPYRLMGREIAIEAPSYVPVRVGLRIYLQPRAVALAVRQQLSTAFSEEISPDGEEGFFYPDRFGFGQSVHQSQVIARAMAVAGVARVEVEQFRRADSHLDVSVPEIPIRPREIARLDRIEFEFEGGHE